MKIIFAIDENETGPSGVISVINELLINWNKKDTIYLILNKNHWSIEELKEKFKLYENIKVYLMPFTLSSEIIIKLKTFNLNKFLELLIRIFILPITIINKIFVIFFLIVFLKKRKIDTIYSHNGGWPGGELNRLIIYAGFLSFVRNRVLIIHNEPIKYDNILRKINFLSDKFISLSSNKIVTVSEYCKKIILKNTIINKNIRVIYNGISFENTKKYEKPFLSQWNKSKTTLTYLGKLVPRKGLHILFEAMKNINFPCELILLGDGDKKYINNLKNIIPEIKWPVYFLGYQKNISKFLEKTDILILPSIQFESFGMSILDGMRFEKPVICSDCGGMKEVVIHGKNGLIYKADDHLELAMNINKLLENQVLRKNMGYEGKKIFEEKFTSTEMIKKYKEILN